MSISSMADILKLKILMEMPGDGTMESVDHTSVVIEASMDTACNVHAWFSIFDKVLKVHGFDDYVIMSGATQLAFNEWRDEEEMRKVAKAHDLVLLEDVHKQDEEPIND